MSSVNPKKKIRRKKQATIASLAPVPVTLTSQAIKHMKELMDYAPPARLKKNLLYIFLIFLEHEHETLPANFREMVSDYYMLFHFLDQAEESYKL